MRRLVLPASMVVVAVAAGVTLSRLPSWRGRWREFLILGLNNDGWLAVAQAGWMALLVVGLVIGAVRLFRFDGLWPVSMMLGIAAVVMGVYLLFTLWLSLVFADDHTEIELDDGRVIVVSSFYSLDCNLGVSQRDGIYLRGLVGTDDPGACSQFARGEYTIEQRADLLIVTIGETELRAILR